MLTIEEKIQRLQGPILVLGASGFVGANIFHLLLTCRSDVVGTTGHSSPWRLEGVPETNVRVVDLLVDSSLDLLFADVKPRTVFNCVAYGAYSFETDGQLIYQTNFNLTAKIVNRLLNAKIACYVHAGSSSEYGDNCSGPEESSLPAPNSDYSVSKTASANLLHYYGTKRAFPCANLRLYSVYGPLEDSSRLLPTLIRKGVEGQLPEFVNPAISPRFHLRGRCD